MNRILMIIFFSTIALFSQNIVRIDTTFNCFSIDESTPLPFSPVLSLNFGIPDTSQVIVEIHEIASERDHNDFMITKPIRVLIDSVLSKGQYQIDWDGKNNKGYKLNVNGKYIYSLTAIRKVKTIYGLGYIKMESKSKVTGIIK